MNKYVFKVTTKNGALFDFFTSKEEAEESVRNYIAGFDRKDRFFREKPSFFDFNCDEFNLVTCSMYKLIPDEYEAAHYLHLDDDDRECVLQEGAEHIGRQVEALNRLTILARAWNKFYDDWYWDPTRGDYKDKYRPIFSWNVNKNTLECNDYKACKFDEDVFLTQFYFPECGLAREFGQAFITMWRDLIVPDFIQKRIFPTPKEEAEL